MKESKQVVLLNLDDILPNRFQPRIKFDEKAIVELSESIKEHGVIQPIIVRRISDKFEIIAGERRYKASVMAGKSTIPAIIVDLNDKDSSEIALIENVQRQNLTPIEEAISYRKILDMGYLTQEALATKLGVAQSTIANKLRLLNLDEEVQEALLDGKISERHARSLLKLAKNSTQREMLKRIIEERLTVRKTDEEINNMIKNNGISILDSIENNDMPAFEDNQAQEIKQTENPFIINDVPPVPSSPTNVEVLDFGFEEINPDLQARELNKEFEPVEEVNVPTNPIVEDEEAENIPQQINVTTPSDESVQFNQNVEPLVQQPTFEGVTNIEPVNITNNNVNSNLQPKNRFFTMVSPTFEEEPEESVVSESQNLNNENIFNQQVPPVAEPVVAPEVEPLPNIEPTMSDMNVFNNSVFDFQQMPNQDMNNESIVKQIEPAITNIESENISFSNSEPVVADVTSPEPVVYSGLNLRDVINKMRTCADQIEAMGFDIDTEEYDLDDIYQVIFKIKK